MTRFLVAGALAAMALGLGVTAIAHPAAGGGHAPRPMAAPPAKGVEAAAVVDAFHAALKHGDATTAAALFDDGAVIFEEGEAEHGKADYAAEHLPADIAFTSGVTETVTARTVNATGDMALVATEGRTMGRYHDKPVDRVTTETMVLRRGQAGWRIVHIHWSSRAAPAG